MHLLPPVPILTFIYPIYQLAHSRSSSSLLTRHRLLLFHNMPYPDPSPSPPALVQRALRCSPIFYFLLTTISFIIFKSASVFHTNSLSRAYVFNFRPPASVTPASSTARSTLHSLPHFSNRFDHTWNLPKRVYLPNLKESAYRILYSPLREMAGDGIGHAFASMNAEVGAAIRFNLTYTHRIATYAALTEDDKQSVENLFAWGNNHIPRTFIRQHYCKTGYTGGPFSCQLCHGVRKRKRFSPLKLKHIVIIPENLTYVRTNPPCVPPNPPVICAEILNTFLQRNNKPYTLFQMSPRLCRRTPVDNYIDPKARSYFFHQYWDHHGSRRLTKITANARASVRRETTAIPLIRITSRRRPIQFHQHQLVFAIHARRGDFFQVNRHMVSVAKFASIIRQVMSVVQAHGGIFSKLPVSINIYSEGQPKKGYESIGHDVSAMTDIFLDSDGKERSSKWIRETILGKTSSDNEKNSTENPTYGELFPNGLEVRMHVSTKTITVIHHMVAADVFIASDSAMGKYIVSSLSRGIHLHPSKLIWFKNECCQVPFDAKSAQVTDIKILQKFWRAFVEAHKASVTRAHYQHRLLKYLRLAQ